MDFTWEQLNTGNWKDVSVTVGWREMYSVSALLKAANLSKKRLREALVELDKRNTNGSSGV